MRKKSLRMEDISEAKSFMAKDMSIDIVELSNKLRQDIVRQYSEEIWGMISKFREALKGSDAEDEIQKVFDSYEFLYEIPEVYGVIDSLRHAFDGFAFGGLHHLYTRQEREVWYPKVILTKELVPNDINDLNEPVIIFRGCDKEEFNTATFGQSWTTSREVATLFAFKHYSAQPWFNADKRTVLKAVISKQYIFYSDQCCEFEVVVDTARLEGVLNLSDT